MIKINVKTVWLNKVGIRDKFVREAESKGEGITIQHGDAQMVIPASEIRYKTVGRSVEPFFDKFSNEKHYLIYFEWRPDLKQAILL